MYNFNQPKFQHSNILDWRDHGYTGKGVRIAVFETTQLDINFPTIKGRVFDTMGNMNVPGLENSHSLGVVSVISEIAPDAEIFIYKTNYSEHKRQLEKAWEDGCRIVNYSASRDFNSGIAVQSEKEAYEKGMLLISSSGNGGKDTMRGEDLLPYWLSVGAIDCDTMQLCDFSATGETLDIVNFCSVEVKVRNRMLNSTTYFGGTSCASAYTTGMFALVYQWHQEKYGKLPTARESHKYAFDHCKDLQAAGHDANTGHGLFILPKLWNDEVKADEIKPTAENPLAVEMIKPNGKTIFVHIDIVREVMAEKGYRLKH